jgi:putative phosphonate metabolism protein
MSASFSPRYAIYYTPPPDHPLTLKAATWLGRDVFGREVSYAGKAPLTDEPRRYGFHATMKAPFRLRDGASLDELERALGDFVASRFSCPIGPLKVDLLDGFFALVPEQPSPILQKFAACVVERFDHFRAPMNAAEIQRRHRIQLDETETNHLARWGYPYVFDRFRFHMTLTNRIPPEDQPRIRQRLEAVFGPFLVGKFWIDALSLFFQAQPDADFIVHSRFSLKTPTDINKGGER